MPRGIYERTPELRARLSEALKGRKKGPLSPEVRAKVSEALKRAWERRKACDK